MEPPQKIVAATELKNRLGNYLSEVIETKVPLLIELHGKPAAVIVDIHQWNRLEKKPEEKVEHPWVTECRELVEKIGRNHPRQTPAVECLRTVREET